MSSATQYEAKPLPFTKPLTGISEKTIQIHHDKLYAGYVAKMKEVGERIKNITPETLAAANQSYSDLRGLRDGETFAQLEPEFAKQNAVVLAASTDSAWSHKAWFERDLPEVAFPILADTTHALARAFDVYDDREGLAERGLFIIDPEGMVKYALVSAGSVGRSVEETLRVLKALQTGDLCPVDWKPGEKTLGKA